MALMTADFDYDLPEELIAQSPAVPRDSCKLLVLNRAKDAIEHRVFSDIVEYLNPHDLLVANETRVLPARLLGRKRESGGVAECLLITKREDLDALGLVWECLVKPGRRLKSGACIEFYEGGAHALPDAPVVLQAEVLDFTSAMGGRLVRFNPMSNMTLDEALHRVGKVPLPPYIKDYEGDQEHYQTVYAISDERSAAAPTAGLHFTPELLRQLNDQGVGFATVELEVGIDTFRIVTEEDAHQHKMHTERYHVPAQTVEAIEQARMAGGRIIAVGTTSVRSLESAFDKTAGCLLPRYGASTDLFLTPGSSFNVVDAMITNFHVPRSTLMMLVSAFASRDQIMRAYEEAKAERYRFLSFGDAMFIC